MIFHQPCIFVFIGCLLISFANGSKVNARFDINNDTLERLEDYGPVANIKYSMHARKERNIDIKVWAQINQNRRNPLKSLLTLVRLDNVEERIGERMSANYGVPRINDRMWRDWRGWPIDFVIKVYGHTMVGVPSNPSFDSMQIELEGFDFGAFNGGAVDKSLEENNQIPKIIHQIGSDRKGEPALKVVEKALMLTKLKNPFWEQRVVSIDEMGPLIEQLEGLRARRAFDKLKPMAYKADLYRYVVLYHYGGVYMDSKLVPRTSFDVIIGNRKSLLTKGQFNDHVQIALLGMVKGDPLMRRIIDKVIENVESKFYGSSDLSPTGPALLGKLLKTGFTSDEKDEYFYEPALQTEVGSVALMSIATEYRDIIYHNGEYRRMQTFSSIPPYQELWKLKDVYEESIIEASEDQGGDDDDGVGDEGILNPSENVSTKVVQACSENDEQSDSENEENGSENEKDCSVNIIESSIKDPCMMDDVFDAIANDKAVVNASDLSAGGSANHTTSKRKITSTTSTTSTTAACTTTGSKETKKSAPKSNRRKSKRNGHQ